MMPTPTPAPPMPMQAMPAPMYFAATGSITNSFWFSGRALVARVNRIVEIDASEDGEDVGLQEGDQRLQREKNDNHCERQHAAGPTDRAKASAHEDDEAGEDLQRDMAGEHVGEQTHAVRDRARHERQDFDRHDERQNVDRHALRYEQVEEVQSVAPQTVNEHGEEHRYDERGGDDDVAGDGEGVRDQSQHVQRQHEHEDREDEGKELHAFG